MAQSSPVDADGQRVALRPVTFGNAGEDIPLAEQASAPAGARPRTLDLPPAGSDTTFGPGAA